MSGHGLVIIPYCLHKKEQCPANVLSLPEITSTCALTEEFMSRFHRASCGKEIKLGKITLKHCKDGKSLRL